MSQNKQLLQVRGLKKYFPVTSGLVFSRQMRYVKAVDDISLRCMTVRPWALWEKQAVEKPL